MLIRLSRAKGAPVLTCVRDDGSTTYSKSRHGEFFARHDLMHYAVETTLGLKRSFFGLVAEGWSIPSFAEPGAAKELPAEAAQTEFIVGQLEQEYMFRSPREAGEFNRVLAESLSRGGTAVRALTAKELDRIRTLYGELLMKYALLGPDESLVLEFK